MATISSILHLTPFFSPNIGGVETHLTDLTTTLSQLGYKNLVLTYSPITTPSVKWHAHEQPHTSLQIVRFFWFGHNLFHRLEKKPLINFLYITPYLLIRTILYLLIHQPKIDTIHSHGINAALIGIIVKNLFHIPKHIVSLYSSYDNVPLSPSGLKQITTILNHTDVILGQSNRSLRQLRAMGVNKAKLFRYSHWINTNQFAPQIINHPHPTILFIGRLIPPKNALLIAKVAKYFPEYRFLFVGEGPDYSKLKKIASTQTNITLYGNIPYSQLHHYYVLADIFCLPSKYDEGWGRVLMESISCGVPVLASNMGAVPEVVDNTVSVLFTPTLGNLKQKLQNINQIISLKSNCRAYALKHFSSANIKLITQHY